MKHIHPELRQFGSVTTVLLATATMSLSASALTPAGGPQFCFFDKVSSSTKSSCGQVAAEVVEAWLRMQPLNGRELNASGLKGSPVNRYAMRVEVHGFAPDTGPTDDADLLRVQRSVAVISKLKRYGMPDDAVEPIGFGRAFKFIPNAPTDPQNRVAEIVFIHNRN